MATTVKWKKDPLREVLKKDIMEGRITPEMKPADAAKINDSYSKMGPKLFASRLKGMHKVVANYKPPKEKWNKKNPARIQMQVDILKGRITPDMGFKIAQESRAIFGSMKEELFKSRLTSMRAAINKRKEQAAQELALLKEDIAKHPRSTTNLRGEPEWHLHKAKELLKTDMDANLHKTMKKKQLYESREEYKEFALDIFRGHIYQEDQSRKWREQWVEGRKEYTVVPSPPSPSLSVIDDPNDD